MSWTSTYLEGDLVNIIASMTFQIPHYPNLLRELGYRIEHIEKEFDVTQDGKAREVKFDLVLNNLLRNHSIGCECKSGGTDPAQLQKYSLLTSGELVRVGGVSSNIPSSHTHDVAIVCNSENVPQIDCETNQYRFPIVSISRGPTTIQSCGPSFQDDDLQSALSELIPYPEPVFEVFRVGSHTPVHKYVKLVAEELVAAAATGTLEFTIADIAPGVAAPFPGLYPEKMGAQLRKDLVSKIERVLREGSAYELNEFFAWDPRTTKGKFTRLATQNKFATLKAFKAQATEMAERLRLGSPVPSKYRSKKRLPPGQMTLKVPDDES